MMTGPENWKIAYPVFLLLMVVLGTASYLILRKLEARDRARLKRIQRNWAAVFPDAPIYSWVVLPC